MYIYICIYVHIFIYLYVYIRPWRIVCTLICIVFVRQISWRPEVACWPHQRLAHWGAGEPRIRPIRAQGGPRGPGPLGPGPSGPCP